MAIIKGVNRIQGIMVKKGNPLGIKGIEDLENPDVRYVNRQRGAGTRVLLDCLKLKQLGLDSEKINGYDRENGNSYGGGSSCGQRKCRCGNGRAVGGKSHGTGFY